MTKLLKGIEINYQMLSQPEKLILLAENVRKSLSLSVLIPGLSDISGNSIMNEKTLQESSLKRKSPAQQKASLNKFMTL